MKKDQLKKIVLFRELSPEELDVVASIIDKKLYFENDIIYNEGEEGGCLYIIHKGKVKITRNIREGEEETLGTLTAGAYFGSISLMDGEKHSATVKALVDSEFFMLKKDDFDRIAQENPSTGLKILKAITIVLASFLRSMDAKFIDMVHYISLD